MYPELDTSGLYCIVLKQMAWTCTLQSFSDFREGSDFYTSPTFAQKVGAKDAVSGYLALMIRYCYRTSLKKDLGAELPWLFQPDSTFYVEFQSSHSQMRSARRNKDSRVYEPTNFPSFHKGCCVICNNLDGNFSSGSEFHCPFLIEPFKKSTSLYF